MASMAVGKPTTTRPDTPEDCDQPEVRVTRRLPGRTRYLPFGLGVHSARDRRWTHRRLDPTRHPRRPRCRIGCESHRQRVIKDERASTQSWPRPAAFLITPGSSSQTSTQAFGFLWGSDSQLGPRDPVLADLARMTGSKRRGTHAARRERSTEPQSAAATPRRCNLEAGVRRPDTGRMVRHGSSHGALVHVVAGVVPEGLVSEPGFVARQCCCLNATAMVLDLHPIGSSRAPSLCLCTGRNASGQVALPWVVAKRAPRRHRLRTPAFMRERGAECRKRIPIRTDRLR